MHKASHDILVILCDSLGAKHIPLYGYPRCTTPSLGNRIEQEGWAVYKNCFSTAQWTLPAHASLFSGLFPSEHGINGRELRLEHYSFVEALREMGYHTVGISGNHLIHRSFTRGWSEFYEVYGLVPNNLVLAEIERNFVKNLYSKGKLRSLLTEVRNNFRKHPKETLGFILNKISRLWANPLRNSYPFTRKIVRLVGEIRKSRDKRPPIFMFVNIMETHHDYNPPNRFLETFTPKKDRIQTSESHNFYNGCWDQETLKHIVDLYDGEILCLDHKLNELIDLWGDGIVFITSDHGDLHGEHGGYSHTFTTYNDLVHIPLLVRWPRDWNIKGEISRLCQINDIYATIMDLTDAPFPYPSSSLSLLGSSSREWAVMQSTDVNFQVFQIKSKVPHLQLDNNMQPMMSLVTKDLWKITERMDGSIEIYNLNQDFYESGEGEDPSSPKGQELIKFIKEKEKELGYAPVPVKV